MRLARFRHKGLRRLYEDNSSRSVPPAMADKLRKLLFAMESARSLEQLGRFPGWRLHALKGGLAGYWSLTVTGNWRVIFRFDPRQEQFSDIDLVDYH